eukprot:Lithocolla_globosa_v1_NODE_5392_length_1247_cov_26.108221.p1 type:complete len:333 gc:universal NODE_5392_length_1247_cov_26.108221:1202-204(-)
MVKLVLLGAAVAFGAVENVAFEPQAPLAHEHMSMAFAKQYAHNADPVIAELVANVSTASVERFVTYLSGEASSSSQNTRVSGSNTNGYRSAATYVRDQMSSFGFDSSLDEWSNQYGPNVISILPGAEFPDELVVLGAHLDDIPSNGRAPGANDDGSGSSGLLAIAEVLSNSAVRFKRTLVLEHYSGEEQGLRGSRNLASRRRQARDNVVVHIQQDMTGYRRSGDPIAVAMVQDSRATDPVWTATVQALMNDYAEGVSVYNTVLSGSNCCSDHQSYVENGFSSVGLIEIRGYTGDPQYHRSGDLVYRSDYSTEQVAKTAGLTLAAALEVAEIA